MFPAALDDASAVHSRLPAPKALPSLDTRTQAAVPCYQFGRRSRSKPPQHVPLLPRPPFFVTSTSSQKNHIQSPASSLTSTTSSTTSDTSLEVDCLPPPFKKNRIVSAMDTHSTSRGILPTKSNPSIESTSSSASDSDTDSELSLSTVDSTNTQVISNSNFAEYYTILPTGLGTGGQGTVRECVRRQTQEVFAVKSIVKSSVSSSRLDHLRQEPQILASVQHPSIIRMVDCYEDETHLHIVTEKCLGGELYHRIEQRSGFDEPTAARIMKGLLEAVAYLHARGLVHRDIKPENILFETQKEDSPIKLIDFGQSRRHRHEIDTNMWGLRGTMYYMAPEVLQCNYSSPADNWSSGVVAYLLLCGYPPFNGDSDYAIYASIRRGNVEFPQRCWANKSPECIDFIKGLLQKDPRRRLTAQEALMHPWIVQMTSTTSESR
jgi:hypothetical protein